MRTYLEIPYEQINEAKSRGARFDWSRKQWYCPDGVDLAKFQKWLPEYRKFWSRVKRSRTEEGA